ncbi:hypothetical protein EJ02DRAFT_459213 [Clathrospora elynae]|uniref:Transposase IS30-like HTH domain-containing protein n=1 Tax=Clathrospora elynae TaxID=706981 RepID=A0A6A5S822_9PLEO|nr:hypothetical protein EJ02DRAFT_459213 [Clathrospora elynae]
MPSLHQVRTRDASRQSLNPRSCLTYRQRVQIETLHHIAGWSYSHIHDVLNIPRSSIRTVCATPETPKKPQDDSAIKK